MRPVSGVTSGARRDTPAAARQRPAGAGTRSPRRPGTRRPYLPGRSRWLPPCFTPAIRVASRRAAVAVLLSAVVAACSARGPERPASLQFGANVHPASLATVQKEISVLYRDHPGLTSFSVRAVQYTARSRDAVLQSCSGGGMGKASSSSSAAESQRVLACAPLIFYYYSYGKKASVPASVSVAEDLYSYAVTTITGPLNARSVLDSLLSSWGLPVRKQGTASSAPSGNPAAVALTARVSKAMLAQHSVHVVVRGRKGGSPAAAEKIVADVSTTQGAESMTEGKATARIRIRPRSAYISGNSAGLTTLIGLPAADARKAGSHWVAVKAGTAEYKDLAREDTLAALPASILPNATDSVRLTRSSTAGKAVDILSWHVGTDGSSTAVHVKLVVAAVTSLPLTETSTVGGDTQTVSFGGWGQPVTAAVPDKSVPYPQITG